MLLSLFLFNFNVSSSENLLLIQFGLLFFFFVEKQRSLKFFFVNVWIDLLAIKFLFFFLVNDLFFYKGKTGGGLTDPPPLFFTKSAPKGGSVRSIYSDIYGIYTHTYNDLTVKSVSFR